MADVMRNRISLAVIAVLLLVIGAMAYKFIVVGSALKADDGRAEILLEPGERDLVLKEMRGFVAGLQLMSDALSKNDMKAVAEAAREMGMAKSHDVPLAILGKLPLSFKTLAFGTHGGFDTIAKDAEAGGTPQHTLGQLSEVLQKCVACHESYRLKAPAGK
ncbi:Cytochrome c OS=Afipia felis OX=1035 GN=BN961_03252 PE=4 SV=1 [Afipia felis]